MATSGRMQVGQASLFVQLCLGNGGRLLKRKRSLFAELSDVEVQALEAIVGEAMRDVQE
ncbi:MAG: hypothetical protein JWM80_5084 [Cyanobacteria bacterium RYN_339]|nr:hypothetical protein [Cyanobacteria bacterium RYN_339]